MQCLSVCICSTNYPFFKSFSSLVFIPVPVACLFFAGMFLFMSLCAAVIYFCACLFKDYQRTVFDFPLSPSPPVRPAASAQSDSTSVVVAGYNVSAPAGSKVVLQCVSGRMVWTRDSVRDRQRVVHWDLYRAEPDYAMERVVDMFSAGDQRIYNSYNLGRVGIIPTAFRDGNFSLVIKGLSLTFMSVAVV